jgi:hypothetical protein
VPSDSTPQESERIRYCVIYPEPGSPWPDCWRDFAAPGIEVWEILADLSSDAFKIVAFIAARTAHGARNQKDDVLAALIDEAFEYCGLTRRRFLAAIRELVALNLIEAWTDENGYGAMNLVSARDKALAGADEIQELERIGLSPEGIRGSREAAVRRARYARLTEIYGERCLKCGTGTGLQIDHVVPFSKGGSDVFDNLQLLCRSCRMTKDRNGEDFRPKS